MLQNKGQGRGVAGSRLASRASGPSSVHPEAAAQSSYPLSASKMCVMLGKFLIGEMAPSHRIPMSIGSW